MLLPGGTSSFDVRSFAKPIISTIADKVLMATIKELFWIWGNKSRNIDKATRAISKRTKACLALIFVLSHSFGYYRFWIKMFGLNLGSKKNESLAKKC
jgi:hypothetical protein